MILTILTLIKVWTQEEKSIFLSALRPQQTNFWAVDGISPVTELVTRIARISENIKPLIEGDYSFWAFCKAGWCIVVKVLRSRP